MSGSTKRWPGYVDEAHPEIFCTAPPQPTVLKPGQLTKDQVQKFFDEGFLLVDSFFKEEELNPAKDAINALVDELAQKLYKGGKIKSLYSEYGYESRLTKLEEDFPGANILLHKLGKLPQAFRDVWSNERLLNVAEQLLGTSDLVGHPVWNLRCKTPSSEAATVPWHQDSAYLDNRSYTVFQLTAWIPLMDADVETGCMQIVRHGHKTGRVATHTCCSGDTWYTMLSEDEMRTTLECDLENDIVTCPVKYGGLLLLNNMIPHQSLNNKSNKIRWSLDLRWQTAEKDVGFYGLKEGVRMRSSADPSYKINWEPFDAVTRHDRHKEAASIEQAAVPTTWHSVEKVDDFNFDTTIAGPWMLKWEMVHHNRHTDALPKDETAAWGHLILG
jgi:hypothetical protein